MNRHLLLFALSLLLWYNGHTQQALPMAEKPYADSLIHIWQSDQPDSDRAKAGYLLSDFWRTRDTARSKLYLTEGRRLAKGNSYLQALYFFYEGQYYFNFDKPRAAEAFKAAQDELGHFQTPNAWQNAAASWYNYGLMVRNEKGDSYVIDILINKAIPLSEKAGNPDKLGHFYVQLATLLMNNARFDKAEFYNQKAIELLHAKAPTSTTMLFAYLSATSTFIYDSKNDSAKKYLDSAKAMLTPYPESINYPDYYYNEGLYYTGINQYDKALVSLDKGIASAGKYHQGPLLQILVFRKYSIFQEQKDYKRARQFLMDLVKEGSLMAEVNNRRTLYDQLAKTDAALGNMSEAYHWQALYSQLSDSLHGNQLKEKIAELEARFQNSENQKRITSLQEEKAWVELSAKNSRLYNWLLGSICLLLLVTALFSWFAIRNQRKLQRLKVTKALLDGEERERKRIAQDLHDGLGGMLAGVRINLSGWAEGKPAAPQDIELHKIIGQLDRSVGELRHIARNMMPESLLKFGLDTALKDLCEFYMRKDIHIEYQSFDISSSLSFPMQLNIYRIVQEVLANAVRHAKASNIILQCSQNDDVFFITVEDNGIGFDPAAVKDKKGLGMSNVRARVEYMKGKMEVVSTRGEGTTVNIELSTYDER